MSVSAYCNSMILLPHDEYLSNLICAIMTTTVPRDEREAAAPAEYCSREHEFSIYNNIRRSTTQTSDEAGRQLGRWLQ